MLNSERYKFIPLMGSVELGQKKEIEASTKIIETPTGEYLMEICEECITNCKYCYGKDRFIPKRGYLSLEIICSRLDWLEKFTNIKEITILGGEALLNPDFKQIIKEIQRRGYHPTVITSGVTNPKIPYQSENLQYLLDEYANGDASIELSYHHGRNEKVYHQILEFALVSAKSRQSKLKEKSPDNLAKRNIFSSTILLDRNMGENQEKFSALFAQIIGLMDRKLDEVVTMPDNKVATFKDFIDLQFEKIKKHYAPASDSTIFSTTLTFVNNYDDVSTSFHFRFRGVDEISIGIDEGGTYKKSVVRPQGSAEMVVKCPSKDSSIGSDGLIHLEAALVRYDGHITFTNPTCIGMTHGLVDIYDPNINTIEDLRSRIAGRLRQIKKTVAYANRVSKFKNRPSNCHDTEAIKGCTGCPLDVGCNNCINQTPPHLL